MTQSVDEAVDAVGLEEQEFFQGLGVSSGEPEPAVETAPEVAAEAPADPEPAVQGEASDTRTREEILAENAELTKHANGLRNEMVRYRRQAQQKFDNRFSQLEQVIRQQQQPEPPPLPDDPIDRIEARLANFEDRQRLEQEMVQQRAAWEQQQYQVRAIASAAIASEEEFRKEQPDYDEASKFAREQLAAYLRDTGVPEESIDTAVAHQMLQLSASALQQGQSPARVFYDQCVRFGWRSNAAEPAPPAPAPAAPKAVSAPVPRAPASLEGLPRASGAQGVPVEELLTNPRKLQKLMEDERAWRQWVEG